MFLSTDSIPRSAKFRAPGTHLPADRMATVRATVIDELRAAGSDLGRTLETGAAADEFILRRSDLTLAWTADFVEAALKRIIRRLGADLIGGAAVTRLDRTLVHPHPRLPYRRALRIVGGRGWRLPLGEDLPPDAAASLVRFCGLLPVHVLYLPGQPRPVSVGDRHGLSYVLPWAGEAARCELPPAGDQVGVCRVRADRVLQFVLGLEAPSAGPGCD